MLTLVHMCFPHVHIECILVVADCAIHCYINCNRVLTRHVCQRTRFFKIASVWNVGMHMCVCVYVCMHVLARVYVYPPLCY